MLRVPFALALLFAVPPSAGAQIQVELTFDDGPDGSGPGDGRAELNNLETNAAALGEGVVSATLVGAARRSAIDEGRYGRAADLMGGLGSIELAPWGPDPARVYYMWLSPRSVTAGNLLSQPDSWDVHFEDGEIVVGAYRPTGEYVAMPTGARWPSGGSFHHLVIQVDAAGGTPTITVAIDTTVAAPVELGFLPRAPVVDALTLGEGYDGLLDELLVKGQDAPTDADRYDRDPTFCPAGTTCIEEVIHVTPRDYPHEVPVRMKSVWDDAVCTPSSPCPVLFDVSGGNACPDDYDGPAAVAALVAAGFVVVNVDFYCEASDLWHAFPNETSLLIAAKDHVFDGGAARERIAGTDYLASGCSHGAGTVTQWSLSEADHPARTYARSTGSAGLCASAAGVVCPAVTQAAVERFGVASIDEVDLEDPAVRAVHERADLVGAVTEELTRTREYARSWGVNSEGPICRADGSFACNEEGQWGMTYASRRFRDVWERAQPADLPSGYFVEDRGADCRHCAPPSSEAFRCGVCMLRVGRPAMEAACPECLGYDDPTIERGPPGELCPIEASWYVDPLAPGAAEVDAGPEPDAGPGVDGGTAPDAGSGGGCGCRVDRPGAVPLELALFLLGWLSLRRREPRRR